MERGLLKTVPGFHPTGTLRVTKFIPDEFVDPITRSKNAATSNKL